MPTHDTFLSPARTREYDKGLKLLSRKAYFTAQNAAAGDVFQMLQLRANDIIFAAWADVITACNASGTIDLGYGTDDDYFGNQLPVDSVGACVTKLTGSVTWGAMEVHSGSEETGEVHIAGARLGDAVTVSSSIDLADMTLTGKVLSKDAVGIHLVNNTGGDLLLSADPVFTVTVDKAPRMGAPLLLSTADTLDITANTALTQGVIEVSALIFRK